MKPSLRWAVPAAVAAVVAGAAALPAASADGRPTDLAPRTAAQLLTDLGSARATAFSGTVVSTSRLGLPELPGAGDGTGPATLASGRHTLRVWADGADRQRVALLGRLAEYDVVRSGRDVWTWSSSAQEAVHRTLPAEREQQAAPVGPRSTPAQAADAALAALDPTTAVTTQAALRVAGRPARQLVLTPRDATTLVGSVRIAVDAATSAPLRVQVLPRGSRTPALEVGFTDVRFTRSDASVFRFTAPSGVTVRDEAAPARPASRPARPPAAAPAVLGSGWSRVAVLSGVRLSAGQQQQVAQLARRVPEGRLVTTALVSALLTDDGRLLVGAVTPAALQAAAR